MTAPLLRRFPLRSRLAHLRAVPRPPRVSSLPPLRAFASSAPPPRDVKNHTPEHNVPLLRRLVDAWRHTPTKWYPLPWFVGALLLLFLQYRRTVSKEIVVEDDDGEHVIRTKGPWQVHILGALPLRNLSRLWGYLNSLELPVWFRPLGFGLYAQLFGCDLTEIEPADLREYPSLGAFFYRALKSGARPVDESASLVSPADGTVLHLGVVHGERVEQVKGLSYSLDALLGVPRGAPANEIRFPQREMGVVDDEEFANVNGIAYSLDQLVGASAPSTPTTPTTFSAPAPDQESLDEQLARHRRHPPPKKFGDRVDASVVDDAGDPVRAPLQDTAAVARELGAAEALGRRHHGLRPRPGHELFYAVVYLAPGDYHRFHSPAAWVVERRRHFRGELFSVAPAVARRVRDLFVLNERVALLGRWRWGAFAMIPVGATNVGSIKINFDQALRTNVRGRAPPPGTYEEAEYSQASALLGGQPLRAGQEMGGFRLGSTVVLVFEAPSTGFEFCVRAGEHVRVGQALGKVREKEE